MNCENCGTEMTYFREGSTQGYRCKNCGQEVVSTIIDSIVDDTTKYTVRLALGNQSDMESIKALSQFGRMNFLQAKEALQKGDVFLAEGEAIDIKQMVDGLRTSGIIIDIQPPYPY